MVPINALATVNPSWLLSRTNRRRRASVAPEITAVSKPKRNPPRAATAALHRSRVVSFTIGMFAGGYVTPLAGRGQRRSLRLVSSGLGSSGARELEEHSVGP